MATKLSTPGVYIEEKDAFPESVVAVPTAVPAFIGHTQRAERNGKSLVNTPTKVNSLMEYVALFGCGSIPKFKLDTDSASGGNSMTIDGKEVGIEYMPNSKLFFYNAIRFFYANGGGTCYIVSVGTFSEEGKVIFEKADFLRGLKTLEKEPEPTMVVLPDAVNLSMPSCYALYQETLVHCGTMQNRVVLVDVFSGYKGRTTEDVIKQFRDHIGTEYLNYAAAYYPWLETNIVQNDEVTFKNFEDLTDLITLIPEVAAKKRIAEYPKNEKAILAAFLAENPNLKADNIAASLSAYIQNKERDFHKGLLALSPTYGHILEEIRTLMNVLPPSSAIAGIYTMVDTTIGVWKAPANVSLNNVVKPTIHLTSDENKKLNMDPVTGKSINAIRTFTAQGTLVWGARTLDGNSPDWMYVNVRRTLIMLEQSIKMAILAYGFEPNEAETWATVKRMISNFLTDQWKKGALAGSTPKDSFAVDVGLGETMTSSDILDGWLRVSVKLALVRPAEFIVLAFEQQMQKS